jgi:hypothetical protein
LSSDDQSNDFSSYNTNNQFKSAFFADDYSYYDPTESNNDSYEDNLFMESFPDIESDNVTEDVRRFGNVSEAERQRGNVGLTKRRLSNNSEFDFRIDNETDFSWLADYNISELEPSERFFPSKFILTYD